MSKEAHTERYEDLWLPPVPTAAELPPEAREGQMCFVQDEEVTYAFHHGTWKGVVPRQKASGPADA